MSATSATGLTKEHPRTTIEMLGINHCGEPSQEAELLSKLYLARIKVDYQIREIRDRCNLIINFNESFFGS